MDNALPFELTEEAFTGCVVAAMPDGTHAADLMKCDEQGREIEHIRNLPPLPEIDLWAELKAYNDQLNLSLTDAAEITQTVYKYAEYAGGETFG
ncbi:hypothetical protein NAV33_17760 [Pseudomonas stutzeri]|uniref:hypothetical protein n=1 Tax=Stutzerimonas stutzeri TaxID=316 RepID=UPI0021091B9B|nr:hypothetical protein [Stutzerimonas stutzeri]MCQ4313718.1 hypothetical protein [Stutzerimonas stutzeri]